LGREGAMGFRKQWRLLSWINPSFRKTFLNSPSWTLAPLFVDSPAPFYFGIWSTQPSTEGDTPAMIGGIFETFAVQSRNARWNLWRFAALSMSKSPLMHTEGEHIFHVLNALFGWGS
jgi:hypothetical protein